MYIWDVHWSTTCKKWHFHVRKYIYKWQVSVSSHCPPLCDIKFLFVAFSPFPLKIPSSHFSIWHHISGTTSFVQKVKLSIHRRYSSNDMHLFHRDFQPSIPDAGSTSRQRCRDVEPASGRSVYQEAGSFCITVPASSRTASVCPKFTISSTKLTKELLRNVLAKMSTEMQNKCDDEKGEMLSKKRA